MDASNHDWHEDWQADRQTNWQADRLTEWLTGRSSLRDCPSFVFQFYCPVWWIQIKWIYCCIHSVLPSFFRSMLPSPCLFPQRIHFLLLFSPHSFHFVCIKEKPLSAKTKEKPLSRAMRLVLRSSRFVSPRLGLAWVCFVLFYAVCHAFSFVLLLLLISRLIDRAPEYWHALKLTCRSFPVYTVVARSIGIFYAPDYHINAGIAFSSFAIEYSLEMLRVFRGFKIRNTCSKILARYWHE